MKKHLIIGISTVLILIATICTVTFAVGWDKTFDDVTIGKISVPDNVQLNVTPNVAAPDKDMKLVPKDMRKNSKEAYCVNMGSIGVTLSSVGGTGVTTIDELKAKVKITVGKIEITPATIVINNETKDINDYLEVLILESNVAGTPYEINNVTANYTVPTEIVHGVSYVVAIQFKEHPIFKDETDTGKEHAKLLAKQEIKVVINFKCEARVN